MKLVDRRGRVRERAMTLMSLRGRGNPGVPNTAPDGDRLLIRFTYPNDIRGTGFLVWEHPSSEDERFLYLPSLGRVRRIAGAETQESFVGSDFTYEDIGGRELDEYTYALRRRARASWTAARMERRGPRWRLESRRKDASAEFPRVVSLVLKDCFVVVQADIYNQRNEKQKVYTVRRLEQIEGIWTMMDVEMTNASRSRAPSSSIEAIDYNVGLKEERLQPPRARAGHRSSERRQVSDRLAAFIYRWRLPLTALHLRRRDPVAPARRHHPHRQRHHAPGSRRSDPVYQDYERFRDEFGGTRTLIVALQADVRRPAVRARHAGVHRARHRRHRTGGHRRSASPAWRRRRSFEPRPESADRRLAARRPAARRRLAARATGALGRRTTIRRRALHDDLIRGDLVSEDATVTALVVSFDEDRIDEVRAGVIQRIHDIVDPQLPAGVKAYYNGSLEISETYNRVTLDNQRKFTPPILIVTLTAIYLTFRSWRKTLLSVVAIGVSVLWTLGLYSLMGYSYNVLTSMLIPLIVVLAIADDVHIMQHWDEERRRGDAAARVQGDRVAPGRAALRRQRARPRSACCRSRRAASSRSGASASDRRSASWSTSSISIVLVPTLLMLDEARSRRGRRTSATWSGRCCASRGSRARTRGASSPSSLVIGVVAAFGMLRLRVDTNHINFFSAIASAQPVGRGDRQPAVRRLQLPDPAGRAARLAEDARCAPRAWIAWRESCGSSRTSGRSRRWPTT